MKKLLFIRAVSEFRYASDNSYKTRIEIEFYADGTSSTVETTYNLKIDYYNVP